jgi:DNA polymerase-3 subunit epsilon
VIAGARRRVLAAAITGAAIAVLVLLLLVPLLLPAEQRPQLWALYQDRAVLGVLAAAAAIALGTAAASALLRPLVAFVPALAHWLERVRVQPDLPAAVDVAVPSDLATAVDALVEDYAQRHQRSVAEVDAATTKLAEERDLLAAVLADLPAAVIGCSRDGRVLLYTPRAVEQVCAVEPEMFLGLGRTVFTLFRRSAIVHALEQLDAAVARSDARLVVSALLPTRAGTLLHARFTPLAGRRLQGFFLYLYPFAAGLDAPDANELSARQCLTNLRAAAEMLRDFPSMDVEQRERFVRVVDEESAQLAEAMRPHADERAERWPLEDIAADTLLPMLAAALPLPDIQLPEPLPAIWVRADSFSLIAVLKDYCAQLAAAIGQIERPALSLTVDGGHARLQLSWRPAALLPPDRWRRWEQTPPSSQGDRLPVAPAEVLRGHGGELWQQIEGERGVLRLLLSGAAPREPAPQIAAPTYDFAPTPAVAESDAQEPRLRNLMFTVFDTETTGLRPSEGDRIIALGGIRIVNARIVSSEVFETLVSTTRAIDPAAQRIHGIDAQMLQGQPAFGDVLPRFCRFFEDTVLVAHNAAFDLRFLELQGGPGLALPPVLDTMLLSQVVYPVAEGHSLEALAQRLGISVIGRHTALGDAIVTAEVFLRLLPLLEARGIQTLRAALQAAQSTALAKVRY